MFKYHIKRVSTESNNCKSAIYYYSSDDLALSATEQTARTLHMYQRITESSVLEVWKDSVLLKSFPV